MEKWINEILTTSWVLISGSVFKEELVQTNFLWVKSEEVIPWRKNEILLLNLLKVFGLSTFFHLFLSCLYCVCMQKKKKSLKVDKLKYRQWIQIIPTLIFSLYFIMTSLQNNKFGMILNSLSVFKFFQILSDLLNLPFLSFGLSNVSWDASSWDRNAAHFTSVGCLTPECEFVCVCIYIYNQ